MAATRIDRVERLTNLLALLLESERALTLVEITGSLVDQYPEADRPRRAAFERDKAALREIGVPIETERTRNHSSYRIDRAAYELDDLELDADETRALQVAVAAVRTDTSAGRNALWKLGGASAGSDVAVSAVLPDLPQLPVIRSAVASRASLTFAYRGADRRIDPWGLLLRGGFWYVVGHDHDRAAKRTFRVDRFDGDADAIDVGPAGSFDRPNAFDPRDAFPSDPKQIGHAPTDGLVAIVRIDASRAAAIEREVGESRVVERHDDGSISVEVPATNIDAFRSWLLGLLEHAVVVSPAEVREQVVVWLRGVVEATS